MVNKNIPKPPSYPVNHMKYILPKKDIQVDTTRIRAILVDQIKEKSGSLPNLEINLVYVIAQQLAELKQYVFE